MEENERESSQESIVRGMAGDYARSLTQSETGVAWQPLRVEIHIGVGCIPATNLCGIAIPPRSYHPFFPGKGDTWKNA